MYLTKEKLDRYNQITEHFYQIQYRLDNNIERFKAIIDNYLVLNFSFVDRPVIKRTELIAYCRIRYIERNKIIQADLKWRGFTSEENKEHTQQELRDKHEQ